MPAIVRPYNRQSDYAAFAGMWYKPAIKVAYVQPVATDPDYRRLGLGRAAVLEEIRRCKSLGAEDISLEQEL